MMAATDASAAEASLLRQSPDNHQDIPSESHINDNDNDNSNNTNSASSAVSPEKNGININNNDNNINIISRSETALAWFQRCQRQKRSRERRIPDLPPPETPAAAAWAFFQAAAGGTGIPFVDESLRWHHQKQSQLGHSATTGTGTYGGDYGGDYDSDDPLVFLPALELRDDRGKTGKTRTIAALAARFVVATRPSLFATKGSIATEAVEAAAAAAATNNGEDDSELEPAVAAAAATTTTTTDNTAASSIILPRTILLDSTLDVTSLYLANSVSSSLLMQQQHQQDSCHATATVTVLEEDIATCLGRIHVAHVDDPREWVPILESIRCQLLHEEQQQQQRALLDGEDTTTTTIMEDDHYQKQHDIINNCPPTLLLWDGFLSEPGMTVGIQKEISRQLALLLKDCSVGLIYTTSGGGGGGSRQYQFHPSSLQQQEASPITPSAASTTNNTSYENYTTATAAEGIATTTSITNTEPIAQTVLLARDETHDARHEFVATLVPGNQQVPYSLSSAGVLR